MAGFWDWPEPVMWTANREHELFIISHVVILHHSSVRCTLGRISVLYRALASLHFFTFVYRLDRAKTGEKGGGDACAHIHTRS